VGGRIAVVDADNRFVRWTDKAEIHRARLVHRSVHVLLFDRRGRLLVQKRHAGKLTDPGRWDLSLAGHVEEDDYTGGPDDDLDAVYDAVARREALEELGVAPPLERLGRFPPEPGVHYEQVALYRGTSDGPFRLQADEVEAIRHVTPAELDALFAAEPATATGRWFVAWARAAGVWR
jgi:16S rRNA (adenine1518-N6/adenine1519-N6)-dimethyltransferase